MAEANLTIVINAEDNAVCGVGGSGVISQQSFSPQSKKA